MLRENALRTKRPYNEVLNQLLRSALVSEKPRSAAPPEPFEVRSRPMGLRPGIDPMGFSKLFDDLEAEAFLATTRRLKSKRE
jgi:hypothetical protein